MALKTLLVGLGGSGCRVVDVVAGMAHDEDVQCIGFDTDASEKEKLKNLKKIIATSKPITVEDYLKDSEDWEEWCPDNSLIKAKYMATGAGQVRSLSRLVFTQAIAEGRLGPLKEAVSKLTLSQGREPATLRVMIISSFAGGTGSGMFLQTALFLRKFFRDEYHREISIRGLFALPDIFVDEVLKEHKASIYANTYGAFKELNAINRICLEKVEDIKDINMKIDDLFDSEQIKALGYSTDKTISRAKYRPYNLMFLMDNTNTNGTRLPSLDEYINLMAITTFMQVYSPLTSSQESIEDNLYVPIIESGSKALYGSCGASMLAYPYEDIVEYCGVRATIESISDVWCKFDTLYYKALKIHKEEAKYNFDLPELDRGKQYTDDVEKELRESTDRKFNFIFNDIVAKDQESNQNLDRAALYTDKLMEYIRDSIANDEELDELRISVRTGDIKNFDGIRGEVGKREKALQDYMAKVREKVISLRLGTVQAIISDDLDTASSFEENNIVKQLLMKKNKGADEVVHPLSARFLMYKVRATLRNEQADAEEQAEAKQRAFLAYGKAFSAAEYGVIDKDDDEDEVSAEDALAKLLSSRKNTKRNIKRFAMNYVNELRDALDDVDSYREYRFISDVLKEVLKRLDSLISQYERFFDRLPDIRIKLNTRAERLEIKHSNESDITTYLCAMPEIKRTIYDSLNSQISNEGDAKTNAAIFTSLYEQMSEEFKYSAGIAGKRKISQEEEDELQFRSMAAIFDAGVVAKNIAEIQEKNQETLDINVYEAMTQQCMWDCGRDPAKMAKEQKAKLKVALRKGATYLETKGKSKSTLIFWGINNAVRDEIEAANPGEKLNAFFNVSDYGDTPKVEVNKNFSKYMIICYQSAYGITLEDIPKLQETGTTVGKYYQFYQARVEKMQAGQEDAFTPHLDKRWVKRKYLPMVTDAKNREDDLRTATAIWLGLAYGAIRVVQGNKLYCVDTGKFIKYENRYVEVDDAYEFFKTMQDDGLLVKSIIEKYRPEFEKELQIRKGEIILTGEKSRRFSRVLICGNIPADAVAEKKQSDEEYGVGLQSTDMTSNDISAVTEDNPNAKNGTNALNIIIRLWKHTLATKSEKDAMEDALKTLVKEFCSQSPATELDFRHLIYNNSMLFGTNDKTLEYTFEYWNAEELPDLI